MTPYYIVGGLSLFFLGLAVVRAFAAFRDPNTHIDKTVSDPMLLPEFRPGGIEERDAQPSDR